jgi:hypothetical protein
MMIDAGYKGPFSSKEINGIKIWNMNWVPDLKWQPGQEIPTVDLKEHPPIICIGVGIKYKCFKKEEIPGIVSELREANSDVIIGEITIPKGAVKEIANELDTRSKAPF